MSKKFKIAIGGFNHESNTLNPIITPEEDFVVFRGNDFIKSGMMTYGSARGIYEGLSSYGYEIIPTVFARAVPNGVVNEVFYKKIKKEMIDTMKANFPFDAITLALHGSMRVENVGDAEGDLLTALRHEFKNTPIFISLDMHTTITKAMVENANGFVGYKTAPHIDTIETGKHAAYLTHLCLEQNKKMYIGCYKMPILIAGEKSESSVYPMDKMIEKLREEEKRDSILAASYLLGFPWADNSDCGVCSLVVADSKEEADKSAKTLAKYFWDLRKSFKFSYESYSNEEAINIAINSTERPLFLSDSGDNPTAGATGDSTDFLNSVLKNKLVSEYKKDIIYSGFYDPISVEKCITAGVGKSVEIELGGHFDNTFDISAKFDQTNGSKSVLLNVEVLNIVMSYGAYKSKLVLVKHRNILIVITSKHIGFGDKDLLDAVGLTHDKYDIVILKLGYLEDCFKPYSKKAIMALSLGASCEELEKINYTKIKRPMYPLDKDFEIDIEKSSLL